ncbi:uncharacterized protein LOC100841601 [Brachypodium distachyon]|uniref:Uncharacterized protein n=1 Tax=Brachypodium distachyon TaxID=15368 RepID=I1GPR3_BRADI|nr:uncharacterized protein LOC100841601 [Brachypodium distachyon]KQK13859.1 hypothetical protein BRADI_1g12940v3 [Brachypodium distachyon]|eukprot:XP_003561480.1 uncharacterized protein LOC100841601 [Brachypodium distachyon]
MSRVACLRLRASAATPPFPSRCLAAPQPPRSVSRLPPRASDSTAGKNQGRATALPCPTGSSALGWSGESGLRLYRRFCTYDERDDRALEEEFERKFGWMLKIFFLGTAGLVGWQFFPYMGDNLLQQSISLLHVKDPLFKRMGASRLARFAVDDERRMKVVEMGGAQEILNVLEGAKDDKTRKEALKALVALSKSDKAAGFLDKAGAYAIVSSTPNSPEYAEIEACKTRLLKAFDQLKS